MTMQDVHLLNHPIRGKPYDRLAYAGRDRNGVHVYRVDGDGNHQPCKPGKALKNAAKRFGATCFFCAQTVTPTDMTIEHVMPKKRKGPEGLFNLVVACGPCNQRKASRPISDFDLPRTQIYLDALTKHVDELIERADLKVPYSNQSSPMLR